VNVPNGGMSSRHATYENLPAVLKEGPALLAREQHSGKEAHRQNKLQRHPELAARASASGLFRMTALFAARF
jgi:hypothetical protein